MESLLKSKSLTEKQMKNVKIVYKDWKESRMVPAEFVEKSSYAQSKAYEVWVQAKAENDFSKFAPHLAELIELQKEWVKIVSWKGKTYDALLDSYEEGLNMETLDKVFEDLKEKLVPMIKKATEQTASIFPLKNVFSPEKQKQYNLDLLQRISYDLDRGRLDESPHPFSSATHPTDSRLTTAINPSNLNSIWSTMHEAGHGMYEQGLNAEESHLPSGQALSLSIHESQSRFWENMIGKNLLFWKNEFTNLREYFKEEIGEMTPESFWKALNKVEPSLIRIDADELTYHMHIIIRYEMEKAIFEEGVAVEDLPALWNQKYKEYLGVEVPTDSQGILQDVHWSCAMFGYFPTYSLGSMYAAQFYNFMKSNAEVEEKLARKEYSAIRQWLNDNIHSLGSIYDAEEICEKVTGEKLKASYLINYLAEKYNI
jgi:carboxypeptidase Taq